MCVKTWTVGHEYTACGQTYTDSRTTDRLSDVAYAERRGYTVTHTDTLVPFVGQGATLTYVNLSVPYVITHVTAKTVKAARVDIDPSTRTNNGESHSADGDLSRIISEPHTFTYSARLNRYVRNGQCLYIGHATYHDLVNP